MSSATKKISSFRLIMAATLTVLFSAGTASAIVVWTPGASAFPADVAAIQE